MILSFQNPLLNKSAIIGWASFLCVFATFKASAQETFPVLGIPYRHDLTYVFKNASIHTDHKTVIDSATLIVKTGVIEAILVEDGSPVEFDQPLVTIA